MTPKPSEGTLTQVIHTENLLYFKIRLLFFNSAS